ncbi:palmitoyltransferase ZDHHC4-like [Ostrea edulis]|uniref:palmitoyltransferase ZDHHC4-like n=1 Tax=Ostrea edulis TaxID=37623 RepID=UPI0024AF1E68|nr:palmitoyltransferase ZDHHC4-like [Ostrea edulis]
MAARLRLEYREIQVDDHLSSRIQQIMPWSPSQVWTASPTKLLTVMVTVDRPAFCAHNGIGTQLTLQDVLVRYVTTDGDAQGAKQVDEALRALHPLWTTERLADPVHLGQSQFRASNRAVYSKAMFHTMTKEQKKELQRVFSNVLKSRYNHFSTHLRGFPGYVIAVLGIVYFFLYIAVFWGYSGDSSDTEEDNSLNRLNSEVKEAGHDICNMNFLDVVVLYVLGFTVCLILYLFADSKYLKHGPVGILRKLAWRLLRHVVPWKWIEAVLTKTHILLNSRNQVFRMMFGTMMVLGHVEYILDIVSMLYRYKPDENHVIIPICLVFLNLFFYHKCCMEDPGIINARTLDRYKNVYPYDNKMFKPGVKCVTCQLEKPARSKHCSICDRCIHRFDHHCIWTNNDVGGLNHGTFVLFLLTLIAIMINGVWVASRSLLLYTEHYKLMHTSVMVADGPIRNITLSILFQHLFMTFPRIVFMLVAFTLLIPMVGTFTSYHMFLIIVNQTTNERYKRVYNTDYNPVETIILHKATHRNSNKKTVGKLPQLQKTYSRGLLKNLYEVFFIKAFLLGRRKQK